MFPNHGMESHFVSQTKKYRTRVAKEPPPDPEKGASSAA
jgi:hypothetical protein